MTVQLRPVRRLRGTVTVPGDKSISHRALILNALAEGDAVIDGFLPAADCLRTLECLKAYGAQFKREGERVRVRGRGLGRLQEPATVLDCGNSGTTMRLLCGVAAGVDGFSVLTGDASLRRRPMARVLNPLRAMGAQVDGRDGGTRAPLSLRGPSGGTLRPFAGRLETASAQVKSAVLLAALAANGVSRLEEIAPSRDHTERLLQAMGVDVRRDGPSVEIRPGNGLAPLDVRIPADLSAAAFWLVAASIVPDAELCLPAVGVNPTRSGVLDVLTAMGADIERREERMMGPEPVADLVVRSARLRGTTIDGDLVARAIDELPVLAVAAALAEGVTEIRDAAELGLKESDRIRSTAALLRALGATVEERADGLRIEGGRPLHGAALESAGDHRIAMAAAVAALVAEGECQLRGEETVAISYPTFWRDLAQITGDTAMA